MSETKDRKECACNACVKACYNKPGWFKFGELEKVAKHLDITNEELFKKYLAVDWYQSYVDNEDIFVISPACKENPVGEMFPYDPRGECVFLIDGSHCSIHAVSPFECREYVHTDNKSEVGARHEETAQSWNTKEGKKQIEKLLGRPPVAPENDGSLGFGAGLFF